MKKIALDEFCNLKYLSNLEFSPDGRHLCFVVTEADKENNKYISNLYELKGRKPVQLTAGGKERSYQFLDGDTVLFAADRDEGEKKPSLETKYYALSLSGGEARKIFTFPLPAEKLLPLGNGDYLVLATVYPGYEDIAYDKKRTAELLKKQKEEEDYEVVDQVPWWWNGGSFTKSGYSALFYFSSKRKKVERLTAKNVSVSDVKLTKDKKEVWYVAADVKPLLPMDEDIRICRMALSDRKEETLFTNTKDFCVRSFEFGDSFALLLVSDGHNGLNTDCDFYKLSYDTFELTLYKKYNEAIGSSVGSDVRFGGGKALRMVGDTCWFISTRFDGAYLYKLENGEITRLTALEGSVDCFAVCGKKIRTVALHDMKPQEIYDENGKQLTKFNEKALAGKYIAQPEPLNFKTKGHEIHGFVLKPIGYEPGRKYPVIFDIHGGPKTVYGAVFYHEMQYWASLGYFVIFCNPTGSDGRGDFSNIRGKYGTVDYDDLMAFCDRALKAYPDMDKNNLFETGGSYGGFMTNWIIGHTNRFNACVSQRSISNWVSFYGVSDIGVCFATDQNDADPWGSVDKLWEHSPLKYADKCKTPTLFIHSFEDYRCPIDQGYQMFSALVAHGVEAKMVLFRGENHELSRSGKPKHRIRRLDEITKWFESHKK